MSERFIYPSRKRKAMILSKIELIIIKDIWKSIYINGSTKRIKMRLITLTGTPSRLWSIELCKEGLDKIEANKRWL